MYKNKKKVKCNLGRYPQVRDPPGAAVPLSQVPAERDPAVHADVLPQQLLWSATATVASEPAIRLAAWLAP